jgi:hypothetical protein
MKRLSLNSSLSKCLILAFLPLYLLLSVSTSLCVFHHSVDLTPEESHHSASGGSHHQHKSGQSSDFCKFAHSFSPVINSAFTHTFIIFSQEEKPVLNHPSFSTKENEQENFLRGPPS